MKGWLPAALLALCATRHYAWAIWPEAQRGSASKMLGALAALALVWIVYALAPRVRWLLPVVLLYSFEETQAALCSAAYMISPWVVPIGQSICSARVEFDIGAITIVAVAYYGLRVNTSYKV